MALNSKVSSRFAMLLDDVEDPFDKTKKKKQSSDKAGKQKKASKKNASNSSKANDDKELRKMAFGGTSGKKKKVNTPVNGTEKVLQESSQWQDWQKRDNQFVSDTYEDEMQQAIIQSKLEYENSKVDGVENNEKKKKSKSKKKKTVPMNEFEPSMLENGTESPSKATAAPVDKEEELMEKLRTEAKQEMQKMKELEDFEKRRTELQNNIATQQNQAQPASRSATKFQETLKQKDKQIEVLTSENKLLSTELEGYKNRIKTISNVLLKAHELKDKAKLVYDLDNVNMLNQDLTEEVKNLHSQLEQERSRYNGLLVEFRKLSDRKRTNTDLSQ